jgi:hypothetical protein
MRMKALSSAISTLTGELEVGRFMNVGKPD